MNPPTSSVTAAPDRRFHPATRGELNHLIRDLRHGKADYTLADIDISAITDLSLLFCNFKIGSKHDLYHAHYGSNNLISYPMRDFTGLDTWDVSHVTDMSGMFVGCPLSCAADVPAVLRKNRYVP